MALGPFGPLRTLQGERERYYTIQTFSKVLIGQAPQRTTAMHAGQDQFMVCGGRELFSRYRQSQGPSENTHSMHALTDIERTVL